MSKPVFLTAFGETKSLSSWAVDPRCTTTIGGLWSRLFKLHWDAEAAITKPKDSPRKGSSKPLEYHGESRTQFYQQWQGIRQRCNDSNSPDYDNYGGRGIQVCQEWNHSFTAFKAWALANGYKLGLTIERKDSNGNYEPNNCCWIPLKEQGRNRRNTTRLTAFGETKRLDEWAADPRCSVAIEAIRQRISVSGWPIELAIIAPKSARLKTQVNLPGL